MRASLRLVEEVRGAKLENVVVCQKTIGVGKAAVGASELGCEPRRRKGRREGVPWGRAKEEIVGKMAETAEVIDGKG